MFTRSQTRSACVLQRAWRRFAASRRCCPISLCTIPVHRAVRVGRQVYDAQYLAKYIEARGDYRCPMTRASIAPHVLQRVEDLSGIPVLTLQEFYVEEAKKAQEHRELVTYYANTVQQITGSCVLALLGETSNPRLVMGRVVENLRRLTVVVVQFAAVDRQEALTALTECERAMRELVTFHGFTQTLALRFLSRFHRDVLNEPTPGPPGPPPGPPPAAAP